MVSRLKPEERDHAILAEAYLVKGDALKAGARDDEELKDAILAYLRVHLLYGGREATEAKALARAAECYDAIGGEVGEQRAAKLMGILKSKYPNSPYAK